MWATHWPWVMGWVKPTQFLNTNQKKIIELHLDR